LFPKARFLFLVRDPRDAYASYRPRGPWFFRWPDLPVRGATAFAGVWSRLAGDFHRHHREVGGLLLRYEDLERETSRIREHLGLQVAAPSALAREPGHAVVRHGARIGLIERMRLLRHTAVVRRWYDY
jgi:hypothetical protein